LPIGHGTGGRWAYGGAVHTEDVSLRDANALPQEAGFRGVMRLDEARRVEKILAPSTVKTDHMPLKAMLVQSPVGANA
jgi:hypothetical protein